MFKHNVDGLLLSHTDIHDYIKPLVDNPKIKYENDAYLRIFLEKYLF